MALLAIDASTEMCGVALASLEGETCRVIYEKNELLRRTHSRYLLPMIDQALRDSGIVPKEIAAIAVTVGPGSFTGIRIGLATAKGLSVAWNVPVVGVGTLPAIAMNAADAAFACPVLDARRGAIYGALYRVREQTLCEIIPPGAYAALDLAARISLLVPGEAITVLGDATHVLSQAIGTEGTHRYLEYTGRDWYPKAQNVAHLGKLNLRHGGVVAGAVLPAYFRRSEAEEKREQACQGE